MGVTPYTENKRKRKLKSENQFLNQFLTLSNADSKVLL